MKNRQRLSATEIAGGSGAAAGALDYFIAANREKVAGKTMHSMQLKKKLKKKTATDDRQDGVLVVSPIPVPFPTLIPATISPFPIAASVCCNFSHDYVALTFGLRNQPMQQCNGNCKSYDAPPPCGGPPPPILLPHRKMCCANGVRQENELWKNDGRRENKENNIDDKISWACCRWTAGGVGGRQAGALGDGDRRR